MLGYVCWVGLFGGYVVMEWGPEIAVNGKRPDWLRPDETFEAFTGRNWITGSNQQRYSTLQFDAITKVRLPAEHFAYIAIAKGYKPWNGEAQAPSDWDDGDVLWRDGTIGGTTESAACWNWTRCFEDGNNVIGYHPKTIAQPSPADTVTVERMTEAEAHEIAAKAAMDGLGHAAPCYAASGAHAMLKMLGLIRPATKAERIAKSTNLPLADVERVLAAVEEGE